MNWLLVNKKVLFKIQNIGEKIVSSPEKKLKDMIYNPSKQDEQDHWITDNLFKNKNGKYIDLIRNMLNRDIDHRFNWK